MTSNNISMLTRVILGILTFYELVNFDTLVKSLKMEQLAFQFLIISVLGITQHITGIDNVKSLANLAMLCGNLGLPSTGVNPIRYSNVHSLRSFETQRARREFFLSFQ